MLKQLLFLSCLLGSAFYVAAQSTNLPSDLKWIDARELTLEGKGWSDTKTFYDRLPARAESTVRKAVWTLSENSAGMAVRFVTDASSIFVKWSLRREALALPHMAASGVSGVDLYVKLEGKWHWLGMGRPDKFPLNEKRLVGNLPPGEREYMLYLPLYNGIEELKLGFPPASKVAPATKRTARPIVFYGTSILEGGCASRAGMAYPSILGRRLDVPHMNFGFSGNAWSEPEVAQFLAELDPAVYVLDPLPNMTIDMVKERIEPFVRILRKAHPSVPIVLIENVPYTDGILVKHRRDRYINENLELHRAYENLKRSGEKNLFYVSAKNLIGSDGEATVDGTHATDLGFQRMADAIEPTLRRAVKARYK